MLEAALMSGICSMGVDVLLVGPMPTPAIAFLARSLRADAGVMISASHNPYQDNGIKFFSNDGLKLPDEIEARIEELIVSNEIAHLRPTADAIGKAFRIDDAEGRYIEFVKRSLPRDLDFQGIKLVVDCANGAAYKVAPTVLRELGAKVDVIGNKPDGMNINAGCGAVHPALLQRAVKEFGADLGIALDGDADRAIFVCEQGDIINGDHIMAALGLDLNRHGLLAKQTVVGTVMSNFGLELALNRAGITLLRTAVGDRYLLERMMADGYNFGGEQSGHFIFLDHNTTGDGLISRAASTLAHETIRATALRIGKDHDGGASGLLNVKVSKKPNLDSIPDLQQAIAESERRFNGSGRVLVRYSGTEPLLRIMIEGERDSLIREEADRLARIVTAHLS
jgi:phosphoglucosamine mutase